MSALGWSSFIYAHTDWYWWLFTIILHLATIIILPLWIMHSLHLYSDLFTNSRSSTDWRKHKPDISPSYKLMTLFSYLTLTLFILTAITLSLSQYKIFMHYCRQLIVWVSIFYVTAKQFMYLLFLVKLYIVYNGSVFKLKYKFLILMGFICVIVHLITIILFIFYIGINLTFYENMYFAMHCNSFYPLFVLLIAGSFDVFMTIFFLYSFVAPIRLIISKNTDNDCHEGSNGLYHIAIKAIILTVVAIVSKLIMLTFLFFTNSLLLGPIDVVINFLCVLFMTPYYKEKYYQYICCVCIKCGDAVIKQQSKDIENSSQCRSVNVIKENTKSTPVGSEMTVKTNNTPIPSTTRESESGDRRESMTVNLECSEKEKLENAGIVV